MPYSHCNSARVKNSHRNCHIYISKYCASQASLPVYSLTLACKWPWRNLHGGQGEAQVMHPTGSTLLLMPRIGSLVGRLEPWFNYSRSPRLIGSELTCWARAGATAANFDVASLGSQGSCALYLESCLCSPVAFYITGQHSITVPGLTMYVLP